MYVGFNTIVNLIYLYRIPVYLLVYNSKDQILHVILLLYKHQQQTIQLMCMYVQYKIYILQMITILHNIEL
jgi:hypothetical protein